MNEKYIIYHAIEKIDLICQKIINKENYLMMMPECVQAINQACEIILKDKEQLEEIMLILEDVMYGMTQRDEVFLLDTLRYGMKKSLERIYNKMESNELESIYE